MKTLQTFVMVLTIVILPTHGFSQEIISHSIESNYPTELRHFKVYLPNSYQDNPNLSYPVLLVLDGQRNSESFNSMAKFLSSQDEMPELIIVSDEYPSGAIRNRDYKPPNETDDGVSQGAASQFLDYVEFELFPFIDSNYRTSSLKMISGHSRGGLLVLYSILDRPHLFNVRFALSPALWHDDGLIIDNLGSFLSNTTQLTGSLYTNMGTEESEVVKNYFRAVTRLFREDGPQDFRFVSELEEGESHSVTSFGGQYRGFRTVFGDWEPDILRMQAGGIHEIESHYEYLSRRFGFEALPSAEYLYDWSGYFLDTGEYEKMLPLLEKARTIDDESAGISYYLSLYYGLTGQWNLASTEIGIAVELAEAADSIQTQRFLCVADKIQDRSLAPGFLC